MSGRINGSDGSSRVLEAQGVLSWGQTPADYVNEVCSIYDLEPQADGSYVIYDWARGIEIILRERGDGNLEVEINGQEFIVSESVLYDSPPAPRNERRVETQTSVETSRLFCEAPEEEFLESLPPEDQVCEDVTTPVSSENEVLQRTARQFSESSEEYTGGSYEAHKNLYDYDNQLCLYPETFDPAGTFERFSCEPGDAGVETCYAVSEPVTEDIVPAAGEDEGVEGESELAETEDAPVELAESPAADITGYEPFEGDVSSGTIVSESIPLVAEEHPLSGAGIISTMSSASLAQTVFPGLGTSVPGDADSRVTAEPGTREAVLAGAGICYEQGMEEFPAPSQIQSCELPQPHESQEVATADKGEVERARGEADIPSALSEMNGESENAKPESWSILPFGFVYDQPDGGNTSGASNAQAAKFGENAVSDANSDPFAIAYSVAASSMGMPASNASPVNSREGAPVDRRELREQFVARTGRGERDQGRQNSEDGKGQDGRRDWSWEDEEFLFS